MQHSLGGAWSEGLRRNHGPELLILAPSKNQILPCLLKGAAVGAVGALVTTGVAAGISAVSGPAAGAGFLLVTGGAGLALLAHDVYGDYRSGNVAGFAYDAGSVLGGAAVGAGIGGWLGDAIRPPTKRSFSLSRSWTDRFLTSKGSFASWLGTGPDAQSAAQAITGAGHLATFLGGCGK